MKKFILWLIKIFKVDITPKDIKNKDCGFQNFDGQTIEGDLTVKGKLTVLGNLRVSKGIVMYAESEIKFEKDGYKRSNI